MKNIVILSAGKTLNDDLYPFFKDKKKNKLITNYRQKILNEFDLIIEILGYSKKKFFEKVNLLLTEIGKKRNLVVHFLNILKILKIKTYLFLIQI